MTADIAESLGADVVRHGRNRGYGAALQSLFRRAREIGADVMVTLDGDGQHNPGEILRLVEPVLEGKADIVIGSRFLENSRSDEAPLYRRLGIKAITKLAQTASRFPTSDAQSGFRAYGRKALDGLTPYENGMGASLEILLKAKENCFRVVEVPINCNYRGLETSTHGPIQHGVSVVMSLIRLVVEKRPLVFLGIPGVISILLGIFFGFWMFQIYIIERRIVTNVALASIAFILIGIFTVFTAITLYAIARLAEKYLENRKEY
jgi:glycosyltransferase involved in cell wall biosynthesis